MKLAYHSLLERFIPELEEEVKLSSYEHVPETACGKRLPASVREWYSIPSAIQMASKQDQLYPLSRWDDEGENAPYLIIMNENQGVVSWAIDLNTAAPNPAVLVRLNEDEYRWKPYSDTFSDFIFSAVWDWYKPYLYSAWAQTAPICTKIISVLESQLEYLPRTYNWPGEVNYRFGGDAVRIRLWSSRDECDWYVFADNEDTFIRTLSLILPLANVVEVIEGGDHLSERAITKARANLSSSRKACST